MLAEKTMKNNKKNAKRRFIYFRYIFGGVLAVLMIAAMLIPCLEYTVGSQTNKPMSTVSLIANSWNTSRNYLFDGASGKVSGQVAFSNALLMIVIILALLFALGTALAAYTTYCAFTYFKNPERNDKNRIFFLTLVPNRAVMLVYYLLLLPLAFFPRIIILLYENLLTYQTFLRFSVLEPWITALVLYVIFAVLTFVSARFEKELSLDPFYNSAKEKRKRARKSVMTYAEEEEAETDDSMSIDDIIRAEQAERIRKMLSQDEQDK